MVEIDIPAAVAAHCRRIIDEHAEHPLHLAPGSQPPRVMTIAEGYLPLLASFTVEDKAAKGLRSLEEPQAKPQPPVHFSALELVAQEPLLLLTGERGSGKTSFALHLALHLAGEAIGSLRFNRAKLCHRAPRNDEGAVEAEQWMTGRVIPLYLQATGPMRLRELIARHWPDASRVLDSDAWRASGMTLLLIVDECDRLGDAGAGMLATLVEFAEQHGSVRVLALGESGVCKGWVVPSRVTKRGVLPLLAAQQIGYRRRKLGGGTPAQFGNPGLFMLSLGIDAAPNAPHDLVDAWLNAATPSQSPETRARITEAAFRRYAGRGGFDELDIALGRKLRDAGAMVTLEKPFMLSFLAARHLESRPIAETIALFHDDTARWTAPVRLLARRLTAHGATLDALLRGLLSGTGDAGLIGAVVAASMLGETRQADAHHELLIAAKAVLLRIVEDGRLAIALREEAGRHLARWGDPRDLEALVEVPGGSFAMGSALHPNSAPPHQVTLGRFRIGRYPVTNGLYLRFVTQTGRNWLSADGRRAERASAPAVDLTWHDARAFCAWLTIRWRAAGQLREDETVRLPTEPEWERAARGAQPDHAGAIVYPWNGPWQEDRCNSEEAGLNDTCTVGLFPRGRSAYGCDDMCGQVWEWGTTLWGEDMATPCWSYPYRDDRREALDAGPRIRRVLRGGCFSSAKEKACCTYRGSLEPNGFWRGNGFRIVVAPAAPHAAL